jgi:hypothetical protein
MKSVSLVPWVAPTGGIHERGKPVQTSDFMKTFQPVCCQQDL